MIECLLREPNWWDSMVSLRGYKNNLLNSLEMGNNKNISRFVDDKPLGGVWWWWFNLLKRKPYRCLSWSIYLCNFRLAAGRRHFLSLSTHLYPMQPGHLPSRYASFCFPWIFLVCNSLSIQRSVFDLATCSAPRHVSCARSVLNDIISDETSNILLPIDL